MNKEKKKLLKSSVSKRARPQDQQMSRTTSLASNKPSLRIDDHTITLSNLDKILFPKSGITKGQVIAYYQKIAPFFLTHAKNHLIVMHRFPDGIHQGFYQKQIPDYFPAWIKRKKIVLRTQEEQTLVVLDSSAALVYLANQAVLVFHSWLSSQSSITKPDKMVFDIDPADHTLTEIRFAVKKLKAVLEEHKLKPFVMTTGSRSYHVVVPLLPKHTYESVRSFAKHICRELADNYPERFTIDMSKSKRRGRIFLDYLRNSFGATSVACYSLRALEGAPIATPLAWTELSTTKPQQYTIKNIFKRLARKKDPWKDFAKYARPLPRLAKELA